MKSGMVSDPLGQLSFTGMLDTAQAAGNASTKQRF